jgi:hypothetical protein
MPMFLYIFAGLTNFKSKSFIMKRLFFTLSLMCFAMALFAQQVARERVIVEEATDVTG